ncbi:hypothetical protein VNI00_017334 [Paramarasmius palmivorus]|uniref:Uncharacterized protein n=1 Tax=Paramarasmius palmivorus TaxID=297713 RepID=A0AAW0B6U6_9AGAR
MKSTAVLQECLKTNPHIVLIHLRPVITGCHPKTLSQRYFDDDYNKITLEKWLYLEWEQEATRRREEEERKEMRRQAYLDYQEILVKQYCEKQKKERKMAREWAKWKKEQERRQEVKAKRAEEEKARVENLCQKKLARQCINTK